MEKHREMKISEKKKRDVIDRYRFGKLSIENAALELEVTIWEVLDLFKNEGVEAQYNEEDFERDMRTLPG